MDDRSRDAVRKVAVAEARRRDGRPSTEAGLLFDGMTERLYYRDSGLTAFTGTIVQRREGSGAAEIRLDRTAFYPTSGGQPHDTGTIDGIPVRDVWDEEGLVWHRLDRMPERDEIDGTIDWARRFDHMQQHSGQHLLSAGFVHVLGAATVSFHLGSDDSTIDLDYPDLDWNAAHTVETEVNRVVWDDRPVGILFVDEHDIDALSLRRPPKVSGTIRVIRMGHYDTVACGGTHVERTGAVGLLKIARIERYKGGTRVVFKCGGRALADYQVSLRTVQQASADLSVHPTDLLEAVGRLQAELKEARRQLKATEAMMMEHEAERLWRETPEHDGVRRVVAHLADRSYEQARTMASALAAHPRTVALLAVDDPKGVRLVCERGEDLTEVDAATTLQRAAERLGGRAGGIPTLAQGGAPERDPAAVVEALRWSQTTS
jgi:alanyl-tRNA synthetase